MRLLNAVGWACTLGCAAISLTANAVYGFHVTSGVERYAFAVGGVCLDGIKITLPIALSALPIGSMKIGRFARGFLGAVLWVGLVSWSFFCAMQVYEQSRVGRVGQVEADKLAYQQRTQDLDAAKHRLEQLRAARSQEAIQAEVDAAKLDRLYSRSQECAAATAPESRALCQRIASLEGEKPTAMTAGEIRAGIAEQAAKQAKAEHARDGADLAEVVAVTDAGTQGLANVLGWPVDELRQRLAFLFALLIEVSGGLGGWLLTGGHLPALRKRHTEPTEPLPSPAIPEPSPPAEPSPTLAEPSPEPSPVSVWATTCAVKRRGTWTYATEAWQAFNAWAVQNGHAPMDPTAFGKQMKVERGKRSGKTIYRSIALLPAKPQLRIVR